VLNLARDPRWGRNGESGSEDPYLTSQFSLGYTLGFQNGTAGNSAGDFLRGIVTLKWAPCGLEPGPVVLVLGLLGPPLLLDGYTLTRATGEGDEAAGGERSADSLNLLVRLGAGRGCRHWAANTLESSDGFTRHSFDSNTSNFVLQDSYFPAFRTAIRQGGARGIMCAYNSVQGVPSCSNKMLAAVLAGWGYAGYTTSDSDAVADSYRATAHHYWANASEARSVRCHTQPRDLADTHAVLCRWGCDSATFASLHCLTTLFFLLFFLLFFRCGCRPGETPAAGR